MIKAAFFDVDGTLLNSSHKMLESTKQALAQLQANGIRTVLATGRGSFELPPCIKVSFALTTRATIAIVPSTRKT